MIPRGTPILASPSPFQRNFGGLVLGCIHANCTWDTWRRSFSVWLKPILSNRFTEKGHTPKTKINSVKWFWHLRRVWLPLTVPLFYDAFPSIILGSMSVFLVLPMLFVLHTFSLFSSTKTLSSVTKFSFVIRVPRLRLSIYVSLFEHSAENWLLDLFSYIELLPLFIGKCTHYE